MDSASKYYLVLYTYKFQDAKLYIITMAQSADMVKMEYQNLQILLTVTCENGKKEKKKIIKMEEKYEKTKSSSSHSCSRPYYG